MDKSKASQSDVENYHIMISKLSLLAIDKCFIGKEISKELNKDIKIFYKFNYESPIYHQNKVNRISNLNIHFYS